MHILVKQEDFSTCRYEIEAGDCALELTGEGGTFSLPYIELSDFYITNGKNKKAWFTTICGGRMYEGQILDISEVEAFTVALKEMLGGVVNIEIRKS